MKPVCADLISVDAQFKRLKKDIVKAKHKRESENQDKSRGGKKPKNNKAAKAAKASYSKTKSKKAKGKLAKSRPATDAAEEPVHKKQCISKRRASKAK